MYITEPQSQLMQSETFNSLPPSLFKTHNCRLFYVFFFMWVKVELIKVTLPFCLFLTTKVTLQLDYPFFNKNCIVSEYEKKCMK